MIHMEPLYLDGGVALCIHVELPKTDLLAIRTDKGYIMCGALDIQLLNDRLRSRNIVAGRAVGVKTWEQLLEAPLESVTYGAEELGIHAGMKGIDAVKKML